MEVTCPHICNVNARCEGAGWCLDLQLRMQDPLINMIHSQILTCVLQKSVLLTLQSHKIRDMHYSGTSPGLQIGMTGPPPIFLPVNSEIWSVRLEAHHHRAHAWLDLLCACK